MLSHAACASLVCPLSSRADWYAITVDDSFPAVSARAGSDSDADSDSPSTSPTSLSGVRSLAQRRQRKQHKLAAGDFLAPLTPHLYPRTPFCSPSSSPHPLDALTTLSSSPLSPATAGGRKAHMLLFPQQSSPLHHLTVHTSSSSSAVSSALSPHSARSHSVPFLSFRHFDDAHCGAPLSPNSASSMASHCTPFPSPVQSTWQRHVDLAPPSPLLLTRPSSPMALSAARLPSSSSSSALDFSSSLFVPASLLSCQPPLSPAVVPLTPPSSPLPSALLNSPSLPSSSSASWRQLSVPSLC